MFPLLFNVYVDAMLKRVKMEDGEDVGEVSGGGGRV